MAARVAERYFTGKPCKNGHIAERYKTNSICVECASEHWRKSRAANPESHRRANREYAKRNRREETQRHANWYERNKDARASWLRDYRKRPDIQAKRTAEAAVRRTQKRKACPKWVDRKALWAVYEEARRRSNASGTKHHVDHIVPLVHPLVCGLHAPWNLQILTAEENLQKSNSFLVEAVL